MNKDVQVYVKLEERNFNNNYEVTLIGYYCDIIVPFNNSQKYEFSDYEILKKVRDVNKYIENIGIKNNEVTFKCFFYQGDYINTIEDVYKYTSKLEAKVKEMMIATGITKYTIIICASTGF